MITMRTPHAAMRRAAALVAPLLLAGALAGLGPVTAQAATAGCQNWTGLQPPGPGAGSMGELFGVRAISATEAWAVGVAFTGGHDQSLTLHFTGGKWHQTSVPAVLADDFLSGVAATSAKDVWAVGEALKGNVDAEHPLRAAGPSSQTLIVHWNGKAWTRVPSPNPTGGELVAVGVTSPTNALAVGGFERAGSHFRTLAVHWNGRTWTRVATPNPGPASDDQFLNGVSLTSQGNAWAVGEADGSGNSQPVIERWDGTRWTPVPAPAPSSGAQLFAIGSSSAGNAWAVGDTTGTASQVFALHCC
jgi:hypothetical protein